MKRENLYPIWGMLFIICAGLGFIPAPEGGLKWLLVLFSLAFFAVPGMIVYSARREKSRKDLQLVRNLSAASLVLTAVLLIVSILTAVRSEALGNFVHTLLVIISAPMIASGYWALSLFCWACLLLVSIQGLRKK